MKEFIQVFGNRNEENLFYAIAMVYHAKGELRKAHDFYRKAIKKRQSFLLAHRGLAKTLIELERHEEAEEVYRQLISEKHSKSIVTFIEYGRLLLINKNYAGAIEFYEEVLDIFDDPRISYLYHDLALAQWYSGLTEESTKNFKKALENLTSHTRVSEAQIRNNLAKVYLGLEYLDLAENELKISRNKDPQNPLVHALLGILYLKRKEENVAEQELNKALEIDPNCSIAKETLKKLRIC